MPDEVGRPPVDACLIVTGDGWRTTMITGETLAHHAKLNPDGEALVFGE